MAVVQVVVDIQSHTEVMVAVAVADRHIPQHLVAQMLFILRVM